MRVHIGHTCKGEKAKRRHKMARNLVGVLRLLGRKLWYNRHDKRAYMSATETAGVMPAPVHTRITAFCVQQKGTRAWEGGKGGGGAATRTKGVYRADSKNIVGHDE